MSGAAAGILQWFHAQLCTPRKLECCYVPGARAGQCSHTVCHVQRVNMVVHPICPKVTRTLTPTVTYL